MLIILKPGNILVTPDFSVVKLTDFGASSTFEYGSAVGKYVLKVSFFLNLFKVPNSKGLFTTSLLRRRGELDLL